MTMTREKAIEILENHTQYYVPIQDLNALKIALTALRGPTRERVERMFPGCPHCVEDRDGYVLKFGSYCVYNGKLYTGHCKPREIMFCPKCGRPLTDEAVGMAMERLEALNDR